MDIRERIRKMASGEINAEEELKKYEAQIKQQQEEARRKQQEEQEKQRKERVEAAKQRAYETISNRNNMTSARTNFQTQNKEGLATAKKTDGGENTFNKFVSNIKENPQKVASIATNIFASRKASDINSGNATASDKSSIILGNFAQGAFDTAIGAGNLIANPMAESFKFLGKTFNNEDLYKHGNTIQNTMKAISEINSYSSKVSNKVDDKAFQTANTVSRTLGNMAPSITLSALTGGASGLGKVGTFLAKNSGGLLQAGSVAGNEITSNLNEDNSNFGQALATGILKGGVEYGTEKLFGGNILAKGTSLDNIVAKGISNKVKGKVGQFLLSKGYEFAGEQIEELIADNAGYVIDKMINNEDMPDFNEWLQNTGETAKTTFLTSLVLQSLGLGGGTYNEVKQLNLDRQQEQEMNKWLNEAQKIIQNATTQPQNKVAQNQTSEQIKIDSENFAKQVDAIKKGTFPQRDMLVLGKTPQVLKDIGLPDLPITMTQKHLDTIMNETGKYKNANYHGLGEEIVKQLPEAINNPLDIVKSNTKDDSIVLTTYLADKQDRTVIASIKIDGKGTVNDIRIDTNVLTSAYGRNNYEKFMEENIKNGNLLYDIDRGIIKKITGQSHNDKGALSSDSNESNINNSIAQQNKNVKGDTITNNYIQENQNYVAPYQEKIPAPYVEEAMQRKRTLNPTEISNLKQEDASTTPQLKEKNYTKGNKQSSFFSNIVTDAKFLNEDLRQEMSKEENIKYYKGITNAETLEKAYNKLKENGQTETVKWHSKDSKDANAEDVVEGWILLKQYQDAGDYKSAVEVAKKMRDIGTTAGQTVQAYNILSRLTPEGMFYYAQSELNEAYNKMVQGKSKEWIEKNQPNFDLTPEETEKIIDIMQDISTMEDGYDKKVKLAEVQKIITDKIPATKSQSLKAWMRISMLFNPKTQVRNVAGNAVVLPVNMFSDSVSAGIDRIIAKKTGVRTTGNTNLKNYAKGFGKGLFESYNDFRKGINTRNIEGNRFEVTEGRSFNNKGIGKALNRVDNILSFMLDAGDRGFYEATFTNSINNQLVLNKRTEVTQDMIDIATNETLQRTWQDNNAYTEAVLKIRKILNFGQGYGLGDVLIPFAKTPANLTKAIVDYSPVGLVKTLATDVRKLNNSLENGQYTPQLQHKVVQNIGKGMAGSFLYVLGYALANSGVITGEADDDKDVKNFMKNSLGINSYSIKIGDKTFSYDWAQPIATPLAIMSNYVKYSKDNPDANALEKFWKSMNIGTEQLLEQSFMQSLNTVLNGSGSTLENLSQAVLELPARAIPTLSKQIADMVDGTQRTSFVYGKPFESAVNSVVAKLPIASKILPVSRDTLGNEIQKYGGENNLFNVMFNPANTNKGQLSKAGKEIYEVYMETGDTTIFPRTAPYYINSKGEKITMTSEQRSEFQKVTGDYVENTLNSLLNNKDYKKLTNEQKASVINEIVSDSYSKAKYDVLKIDSKEYEKLRKTLESVKTNSYYDYKFKTEDMKKDSEKTEVILKANYTDKEKRALYENYVVGEGNETYEILKKSGLNINSYMAYKLAESNDEFASDKKEDGTVEGKSVSGSAKKKIYEYVNKMNATYEQKLLLLGMKYSLTSNEKSKLANYVNGLKITKKEKLEIYEKLSGFTVYKDGKVTW